MYCAHDDQGACSLRPITGKEAAASGNTKSAAALRGTERNEHYFSLCESSTPLAPWQIRDWPAQLVVIEGCHRYLCFKVHRRAITLRYKFICGFTAPRPGAARMSVTIQCGVSVLAHWHGYESASDYAFMYYQSCLKL